jgi:DNA repair exonuclease SbcCD ATPase subunit
MNRSLLVRRLFTTVGVIAALVVGFGSIRAAAAWTAASAPLSVAPVTVSAIETKLADEQARSAALQAQLVALGVRSHELTQALETAKQRIDADTGHAKDLAKQLKTAKKQLAKLEKSIKAARAAAARAAVTRTVSTGSSKSSAGSKHHDDDEDEDEDDDDEHEGDDD